MIDYVSGLGILGAFILLIGAAWPPKKTHHFKEWVFVIGNALMLFYALMNYISAEGLFFFILLQILVNVGGIFGITELPRRLENMVVGLLGLVMILWALALFKDVTSMFFIVGLTLLALGFSLDNGKRKQLFLALGSGLVAYFSYLVWDPIFLGLNIFFAMFSVYYYFKK